MNIQSNSNYSIFKRISSLILLVICVIVGINLYLMHSRNAQQWYEVESEQLGRSLTMQAAKLVAAPLAQKDQTLLKHYVKVINEGMFVTGAVLFDELGMRYAEQEERPTIINMMSESEIQPLVFVEDIIFDNNTIGYIKLVLDQHAITKHHRKFNQNQLSQSVLVILLSVIAAVLATRLFYKVRNSYQFDEGDTL